MEVVSKPHRWLIHPALIFLDASNDCWANRVLKKVFKKIRLCPYRDFPPLISAISDKTFCWFDRAPGQNQMSWYYKTRYIWYGVDDVSVTWWAGRAVGIGSSVAGWCGDRSLMRGSNIREEDISASSLRERLKKTNRAAARSSRIFDYLCDIVIYTWRRRKKSNVKRVEHTSSGVSKGNADRDVRNVTGWEIRKY